jgi:hypothetical protein
MNFPQVILDVLELLPDAPAIHVVGYIRGIWLPNVADLSALTVLLLPLPDALKINRAYSTDEIEGT